MVISTLDNLPNVESFFGLNLRTASMIIAAISIVHPLAYGCTFFMAMSYLLVTIWILVALFFSASILLFWGLVNNDTLLITIWIWYSLIFVAIMLVMMLLLAMAFTFRGQGSKVIVVIMGMLWYILTIYFILVVNSHRKSLDKATTLSEGIVQNHLKMLRKGDCNTIS